MKTETKNRIASYKRALPRMKERVVAAGFAVLLAAVIAVSATFAWVTLSRAPEVSAVATTLAANGALEIALSKTDGSEPSDADFDESLGLSTDVTVTNLQWGNLINISDPRYGIDDLELRPAQLNTGSLTTSPLWGAVYGVDGRVEKLNSKYTYATWDNSKNVFLASDNKGVRAISSYTIAALEVGGEEYADFEARYSKVLNAHTDVGATYYAGMTGSIGGLGNVMSTYLQSKLNEKGYGTGDKNIALTTAQLQAVCNTHDALYAVMNKECDALVALANLQQYIFAKQNGADGKDLPYTEVTWDKLRQNQNQEKYDSNGSQHKTGAAVTTPEDAISLTGLKQFIKDYNTTTTDNALLKSLVDKSNGGTTVYSNEIDAPVNHLVNPSTCKIDGKTVQEWMAGSKLDLLSLKSGDHLVTLCDGLLKRFEQIASDNRLPASKTTSVNAAPVSAKASYSGISLNINMTGHLCTDASGASDFQKDFGKLPTELSQANKIAEDTYGMAIDFWIRSNHESTYLTLEGATTTDTDGKILSYDGKNRIWGATGNLALTTDSTTQGGGSCYVYYADTPEDMQRSLDLMEFMKVAFVSQDGTLLAKAEMDTQNYLAVNGRVTVPLVISQTDSEKYTVKTDENTEETRYAIKHMKLDEKTLITAIIYIDGENLQNTEVLSAASIQGQLNLQFSSSENMTTVGDNKLLTAERYVTASVSKKSFDFDAPGGDLTTRVTVEVEGSDPQTVEAFFVRAVNNSQGQRCKPIAFTKQANGSWTGDYTFELPGVYYLRYVRLDRVDYALAEPCRVDVSGFAVSAVDWSEGLANAKEYYTTESSYAESVSIEFAGTEGSRVPTSVQARFIRDDGNAVNIDTKYNAAKSAWEGTGVFTASGNYTLSYLILDGNYYDISQFAKTLNLHMGLRAAVYNKNSSLMDEFDSQNPQLVRNKNVQVSILDSSGQRISELKGLKLYYTSGSGGANTVDTDLTWGLSEKDESGQISIVETGYYEGTLPLVNAGRYRFYQLRLDTQDTITSVTEAPVYTIVPPDAPEYDATSASEYNGQQVNFMPLKANATMGPLRISDSAAAELAAVVYNSATGEYYDIPKADVQSLSGTMYYVNEGGGYWKLNLPTYEKDGKAIQDGTWQLVCLKLWNCFDGTTNQDNYRTDKNPLIWCGSTEEAAAYMTREKLTANKTIDFSKLSTTVSCTVNVAMEPGQTVLGDKNADFMTQYKVSELGMSVSITDDAGRTIPANKLGEVKLTVNYAGNSGSNVAVYGYEVKGTAPTHSIIMAQQADGSWTPRSQDNIIWQYVGEYKVSDLSVSVGGTTQSFPAGKHGVPEKYTITSKAPTAANLEIKSAKLDQTEFGKRDGAVTGDFLASYSPKVTVDMTFSPLDVSGQMYAVVPDMSVTVDYQYQNGTSAPNGGYSWTGYTDYESYTDTCSTPTVSGGKYSFIASGSKTLLAGRYTVRGTLHWKENGQPMTESVGNLGSINVWSVQPTVTVTGVSPTGPVTVNPAGGTEATDIGTFDAVNSYGEDYAIVYVQYAEGQIGTCAGNCSESSVEGEKLAEKDITADSNQYADYTLPKVTFSIANMGSVPASIRTNDGSGDIVSFSDGTSKTVEIGTIESGSDSTKKHVYHTGSGVFYTAHDCKVTYPTEKPNVLGTQVIDAVISVKDSATYTRYLTNSVFLRQENSEPTGYRVNFASTEGLQVSGIPAGGVAMPNTSITLTATAKDGYHAPRLVEPEGVSDWVVIEEGDETSTYSFIMRFADVNLTGTASAYPTVTWSNGANMTISNVTVNGTAASSGVKVKPGSVVALTTAPSTGYYGAKIEMYSGLREWTQTAEGDFSSTYTFVMPNNAVVLRGSAAAKMYQINWVNGDVTFTARYAPNGDAIDKNGYAIPGRTIRIAMNCTGGYNPVLTSPSGASYVEAGSTNFLRFYDFKMPAQNVTLAGTVTPYDKIVFMGSGVSYSVKNSGMDVTVGDDGKLSVAPGNIVSVTVAAQPGYYDPRLTSTDVALTAESKAHDKATYTFSMPEKGVTLTAKVTVAPTISIANTKADISVSYKNYGENEATAATVSSASGAKVQPGQTVTVTATYKSGYYNPTVSAVGAMLSERTAVGNGWDRATYTFVMGTANVSLTGGGEDDPTVSVNNNGKLSSATVNGTATSKKVHPGAKATVVVNAASDYYNPSFTGMEAKKESGNYASATYSFDMPAKAVVLTGDAVDNPTVTFRSGDKVKAATVNSSNAYNKTVKVRPGSTAVLKVSAADAYYNPSASAPGVSLKKTSGDYGAAKYEFTMPEANVVFEGRAIQNPTITINSDNKVEQACASFSNSSGNTMPSATITSARPGQTVYVVVQAKTWWGPFHYSSTATSTDVTLTPKNASKLTYTYSWTFTMPEKNVTIKASGE